MSDSDTSSETSRASNKTRCSEATSLPSSDVPTIIPTSEPTKVTSQHPEAASSGQGQKWVEMGASKD